MKEFCNDYILINDNGIDLLRNHFPYRHINYSEIHSSRLYSGYLLQNRLVPLLAGILFICLSIKLLTPEIQFLEEIPKSSVVLDYRGMVWLLVMPLISFFLGSYFFTQSLRKSKILMIVINSGHYNIRIKEFEEADTIPNLILFLNDKLPGRVENAL